MSVVCPPLPPLGLSLTGDVMVFNADSLIEWFASPWFAISSVDRVVGLIWVSWDRQDTDHGRSE